VLSREKYTSVSLSGLFDSAFYLRTYADVRPSDIDPALHYVEYGASEGRWPHPLFDPEYYAAGCRAAGIAVPANPLLHFASEGWRIPVNPHPWFDVSHYLTNHPDVKSSGLNPLFHFCWFGWVEGRSPCAEFDPGEYARWVPEVRDQEINPLLHALMHGQPRLGDRRRAPSLAEELKLRRRLKMYVETFRLGDSLSLKGWLFHEELVVTRVTAIAIVGDQRFSKPCRFGQSRGDVYGSFPVEAARNCGFAATGLHIQDGARVQLDVTFDTGEHVAIELADLSRANGNWVVRRLTESLTASVDVEAESFRDSPWESLPFVRSGSLSDALDVVSHEPSYPPVMVEPTVILISVYRGRKFLRPFFDSLFRNTSSPFRAVIIDNGNDDQVIVQYLRAIAAAHSNVTLIRVDENRGYVGAMCLAIDYAPPGHIVVLNTDTTLPPRWLERLIAPILKDPTIASTTPFTNAGTVCSFPRIDYDNELPTGLTADEIDEAIACVTQDDWSIDLPSGVGFCMAHNRRAVDAIGWYDLAAFGRGYGEENDWCLRAAAAGYRNVMVPNLFVYHKHGGIYQDEKKELIAHSLSVVTRRFPAYEALVQRFQEVDPAGPFRNLVAFRLAAQRAPRRTCLIVDHANGGGANQYRDDLLEGMSGQGTPVILVTCNDLEDTLDVELRSADVSWRYGSATWGDLQRLSDFVGGIGRLYVNQLVGFPDLAESIDAILRLSVDERTELNLFVHDFFYLCPSVTLVDTKGEFCDLPGASVCRKCAVSNPDFRIEPVRRRDFSIADWRKQMAGLVRRANTIACFSKDSATIFSRVFRVPAGKILITPHFLENFESKQPNIRFDEPLHIGIIGAISRAKGADMVAGLAKTIGAQPGSGVRMTILGTIAADVHPSGVEVTGRYRREELAEAVTEHGINLVLVPSICPETFCYVAEEVMALGIPIAVFDIGAPAERVRLYPHGLVLPRCDSNEVLAMLKQFYNEIRVRTKSPSPEGVG
jgi:O-antigen biosynthesis protein